MLNSDLIDAVDALLPQTQCEQCGYKGCKPYATAIVNSNEDINKCPPGNTITIQALAKLLKRPILAPAEPEKILPYKLIAQIDENNCIGCTLCIKACPVDAIVGAPKLMHSIIKQECTGCELCLAPCPVDCITMVPDPKQTQTWSLNNNEALARANKARLRLEARNLRLSKKNQAQKSNFKSALGANNQQTPNSDLIKQELLKSLLRNQNKSTTTGNNNE